MVADAGAAASVAVSIGEITVEERDPDISRYLCPWWDALDDREKELESRDHPVREKHVTPNTTCIELHELTVDLLDGSQTTDVVIEELAVGRSSTPPDESDRSLNDPVDRVGATEFTDNGDSLDVRTFLGEGDANVDTSAGETLSELGLYAGDYFLNHSVLSSDISKDNTTTATITVTLSFTAQ